MFMKVHILDSHLKSFKENMGEYSEKEELFHHDLMD